MVESQGTHESAQASLSQLLPPPPLQQIILGTPSQSTSDISTLLRMHPPTTVVVKQDEDVEGDDELLPAMADDDYSAQMSFQTQSKDNLKVLMDNFAPEQYDRFEAYRRHLLPKQAVRKVIQQTLGQQVSQPVAQIIAGFSKVFVGEMVEKAREVQARRGETGPLSPDHLREAYRAYQEETGRVGAARPLRSKKLFAHKRPCWVTKHLEIATQILGDPHTVPPAIHHKRNSLPALAQHTTPTHIHWTILAHPATDGLPLKLHLVAPIFHRSPS